MSPKSPPPHTPKKMPPNTMGMSEKFSVTPNIGIALANSCKTMRPNIGIALANSCKTMRSATKTAR